LNDLPYPIAFPLSWSRDLSRPPGERVDNTLFATKQAVRFTTLTLLADYLDTPGGCPEVAKRIHGLRRPHWSEWVAVADALCKYWDGRYATKPAQPPRLPDLIAGWRIFSWRKPGAPPSGPWGSLLDGLPGLTGDQARGPLVALWKIRNDRAHRRGTATRDASDDEQLARRTLEVLEAGLLALFGDVGATLMVDERTLHGNEHEGAPGDPGDPPNFRVRDAEFSIELAPLAALPTDIEPSRALVEPILLLDGWSRNKVILQGTLEHGTSESLYRELAACLAAKAPVQPIEPAAADAWQVHAAAVAATKRVLEREHGPGGPYVSREGVDDLLRARLSANAVAIMLLGEPGGGKTTCLDQLVSWRLRTGSQGIGAMTVYLSGRGDYETRGADNADAVLARAIGRGLHLRTEEDTALGPLLEQVATMWSTAGHEPPDLLLVLDGVDEADRFVDLVGALDRALPIAAQHPWVHLVFSMRRGSWDQVQRRHRKQSLYGAFALANTDTLEHFSTPAGKSRPWLEVRPFDAAETERAHDMRRQMLPERSLRVPFGRLPSHVIRLAANPLWLQIIHETYAGRQDLPQFNESTLFRSWLDRQLGLVPGLDGTLKAVVDHLLVNHRFDVPGSTVDLWLRAWRANTPPAARVSTLDPIERAASCGILAVSEAEFGDIDSAGITFAHERFLELLVRDRLERELTSIPDAERQARVCDWLRRADDNDGFEPLVHALIHIVSDLVLKGQSGVLGPLLDMTSATARTDILVVALPFGAANGGVTVSQWSAVARQDVGRGHRFGDSATHALDLLAELGQDALVHDIAAACREALGDDGPPAAVIAAANQLGHVKQEAGDYPGARDLYRYAAQRAAETSDLAAAAGALSRWGRLAMLEGDEQAARSTLEQVLVTRRALASLPGAPPVAQARVATAMADLAMAKGTWGDHALATQDVWRAVEMLEDLVSRYPNARVVRRELAVVSCVPSRFVTSDASAAAAERGVELMRGLVEGRPDRVDWREDLAACLSMLGLASEKASAMLESQALFAALRLRLPHRLDLMHQLAEVRHLLVQGLLKRMLVKGARKWATISLRDIEAVLRERPNDPLVLDRSAIANWDLGASYAPTQPQHQAALQKARDLWDRARRAPGGGRFEDQYREARAILEALGPADNRSRSQRRSGRRGKKRRR